jgi:hypothetical protein
MDNKILDICTPIVYGSPKVGAYHRKALNINNFSFNNVKTALEANPKGLILSIALMKISGLNLASH